MTRPFADLGVAPPIVEALAARGFDTAFAIQDLSIEDALAGHDICGKAQTGSGKTLAFGIPAVQRLAEGEKGKVRSLMLVPTRELATQVFDELAPLCKAMGLKPLAVYGYQHDPIRHEVEADEVTVEHMTHRFITVHQMDQYKVAASIIKASHRTMVFCNTKRMCDRLAADLEEQGVKAEPIHGDLRQRQREKALGAFSEGKLQALVATDVAARGIHVDDVDVVVHFDPPDDHKTYLHRSGRTARAGGSGLAVTFVLWNQELEVKRMQKRLELDIPIVEMFSNDARLQDLANWDPTAE